MVCFALYRCKLEQKGSNKLARRTKQKERSVKQKKRKERHGLGGMSLNESMLCTAAMQ